MSGCAHAVAPGTDLTNALFYLYSLLPAAISLAGNSIVILVVVRRRTLHTSTNILLAGLALSDLLTTLISHIPLTVYYKVRQWNNDCTLRDVTRLNGTSLCLATLMILSLIAYDRYKIISGNSSLPTEEGKRLTVLSVITSIIIGYLVGVCSLYFRASFGGFVFSAYLLVCLTFICACYRKVMNAIAVRESSIEGDTRTSESNVALQGFIVNERRCLRAVIIILLCLFISVVPLIIVLAVNAYYIRYLKRQVPLDSWNWAGVTVFLNGAVNPFIYAMRHRSLRRELSKFLEGIFYCLWCCSSTNVVTSEQKHPSKEKEVKDTKKVNTRSLDS